MATISTDVYEAAYSRQWRFLRTLREHGKDIGACTTMDSMLNLEGVKPSWLQSPSWQWGKEDALRDFKHREAMR